MLLSAVLLATLAQATPIVGDHARIRGSLFNPGEINLYSFTAQAGDVVYAATQTSFSAGDGDTVLAILDVSGNIVESDDNDGSYALYASSLAGTVLPTAGTYYLRVSGATPTSTARPYDLYFQLRRGAPGYEMEPNDDYLNPQPLPAGGWVGGRINYTGDDDVYGFTANAGDTIFVSLDLRGETRLPRTRIMMGIFEGYLTSAEHGVTSQAMAFTVKNAGSYEVALDTGQGPYVLSVTVFPAADDSACTTVSTLVNSAIPAIGSVSATLDVPDDMILGDVDVLVGLYADIYQDIGIRVASPEGTSVGLVQKIAVNVQNAISPTFDDEAAVPFNWTQFYNAPVFQPQRSYRLHWLDGESSQGTWTITVDVNPNQGTYGTLQWGALKLCPRPAPQACPPGSVLETRFATDFETGDAGFVHGGTADSWALGTPASPFVSGCHSGTQCWKTNLTGDYPNSSSQDLSSPTISLAGLAPPIYVEWWQKHNMDDALSDHAYVDADAVDGSTSVRVFEHRDPVMIDTVGTPTVAGWSDRRGRIDALAGLDTRLVFHLDSDATNAYEGLVIDDVTVTGCRYLPDMTVPNDMTSILDMSSTVDMTSVDMTSVDMTSTVDMSSVVDMRQSEDMTLVDIASVNDMANAPSANDLADYIPLANSGCNCRYGGRTGDDPASGTCLLALVALGLAALLKLRQSRRQREAGLPASARELP